MQGHGEDPNDTVFCEYADIGSRAVGRMVRSGPWKYNHYHNSRPELFNLDEDPCERTDLWDDPDCQDICRDLRMRALEGWEPDRIIEHIGRWTRHRPLLGHWVNTTKPEHPDPPWFDQPPENWVHTNEI